MIDKDILARKKQQIQSIWNGGVKKPVFIKSAVEDFALKFN